MRRGPPPACSARTTRPTRPVKVPLAAPGPHPTIRAIGLMMGCVTSRLIATLALMPLIAGTRESAPGRMNKSMALPRRPRLRVGGILQAVTAWPTLVRPWTSAGFAMAVVSRQVGVTAMATS